MRGLLRAEDPVAGIAQAGDNVAVLVEVIVHSAAEDVHIGVVLLDEFDAFGGSQQDHELDIDAAPLFHFGDRGIRTAAGGQHGINDHDIPLFNVLGHLAEVDMGLQGFLVPVHADVADPGTGDHRCV